MQRQENLSAHLRMSGVYLSDRVGLSRTRSKGTSGYRARSLSYIPSLKACSIDYILALCCDRQDGRHCAVFQSPTDRANESTLFKLVTAFHVYACTSLCCSVTMTFWMLSLLLTSLAAAWPQKICQAQFTCEAGRHGALSDASFLCLRALFLAVKAGNLDVTLAFLQFNLQAVESHRNNNDWDGREPIGEYVAVKLACKHSLGDRIIIVKERLKKTTSKKASTSAE